LLAGCINKHANATGYLSAIYNREEGVRNHEERVYFKGLRSLNGREITEFELNMIGGNEYIKPSTSEGSNNHIRYGSKRLEKKLKQRAAFA